MMMSSSIQEAGRSGARKRSWHVTMAAATPQPWHLYQTHGDWIVYWGGTRIPSREYREQQSGRSLSVICAEGGASPSASG